MAKLPNRAAPKRKKARTRFSDKYGILLDLLIELRLNAGLTQQQIAKAVDKSQSHVSLWEKREREINVIDVWKWCDVVGISASQFFEEFDERVKSSKL